jgi:hypothetical protein
MAILAMALAGAYTNQAKAKKKSERDLEFHLHTLQ